MFFVVKKNQIILALLLILTILGAFFFSYASKDKNILLCREFIKTLGYSSEDSPYEISEVIIPEGFGKVYENYNVIQKEAGFDLTPLRGKIVTRYSFMLKSSEFMIINILVGEGKIVGGDIMNPSLSGKMLPLIPSKAN